MKRLKHLLILFVLLIGTGAFVEVGAQQIVDDPNFHVDGLNDQSVCSGTTFQDIEFSYRYDATRTFSNRDVYFMWEYISGVNLLTESSDNIDWNNESGRNVWRWELSTLSNTKTGSGVYRVTPYYPGAKGESKDIVLTRYADLSGIASSLIYPSTLNYSNGQEVASYSFASFGVPEGYMLKWTHKSGKNQFANTSGYDNFPAFVASNNTSSAVSSVYELILETVDGVCTPVTVGNITIRVQPTLVDDPNFHVDGLNDQSICFGTAFQNIDFGYRHDNANGVTYTAASVYFIWEFVSGVNLLTSPSDDVIWDSASGSNVWRWKLNDLDNGKVGTGVYRVTPYHGSSKGVSKEITLTRHADLNSIASSLVYPETLIYSNGQEVPSYPFASFGVPEGYVLKWTHKSKTNLFASASGYDNFPAFVASNNTLEAISPVYELSLEAADGTCTLPNFGSITITVQPNLVDDPNFHVYGFDDQSVCYGQAFSDISLDYRHADGSVTVHKSEVYFVWEYVSGANLLSASSGTVSYNNQAQVEFFTWKLSELAGAKVGSGVYSVTPYYNNKKGESKNITLTRYAEVDPLALTIPEEITYTNGQDVPVYSFASFGVPEGYRLKWTYSEGENFFAHTEGYDYFPAFVAENNTSNPYTGTYALYAETLNGECASVEPVGVVTITVLPAFGADNNLSIATALEDQSVCYEDTFEPIDLTAYYHNQGEVTSQEGESVYFQIEFVSGTNLLQQAYYFVSVEPGETTVNWNVGDEKIADVAGTGTYRVTPYWGNKRGLAKEFSLTVFEMFDGTINLDNFVFRNGQEVPEYTFTGVFPEGTKVIWAYKEGDVITSMPQDGVDVIPAFTAVNNNVQSELTSTFEVWLENSCRTLEKATFTVTILPKTNYDDDLFIYASTADQTICNDGIFEPITLTATHRQFENFLTEIVEGEVEFKVELTSGEDVLGKGRMFMLSNENAGDPSATWDISNVEVLYTAGTGVYEITPYWNNTYGKSTQVTLTVLPELTSGTINIDNFVYRNGQEVPAYTFTGTYPQTTVVKWAYADDIVDNPVIEGMPQNGIDVIPAFKAENNQVAAPVTSAFYAWLENGTCISDSISFTVTVLPKTNYDDDLFIFASTAEQAICHYDLFEPITLTATHRQFEADLYDLTEGEIEFKIELVSGQDVLNAGRMFMLYNTSESDPSAIWEVDQNIPYTSGTGVYEVTPYWNNTYGKSTQITLTVSPELDNAAINLSNMTFRNGQEVPAYTFTGTYPEGAVVKWQYDLAASNNMEIGSASEGTNVIPAFVADNETDEIVTGVYRVWLEYNGCTQYDENDESTYVTFEYIVLNNTELDDDLFVLPVEAMAICYDTNTFGEIVLTADHARFSEQLMDAAEGDVMFTIELKSGQNVLGYNGTYYPVWTSDPGSSVVLTLDNDNPNLNFKSGTGVYTVTPYWRNQKGHSIDIELTIAEELKATDIVAQNFVYRNGQEAPAYTFTGTYPQGAVVKWAYADNMEISNPVIEGMPQSGADVIPAFVAINNQLEEPITSTFYAWLENGICVSDSTEFTVTVYPQSVENDDLFMYASVSEQNICSYETFVPVTLTATHRHFQSDLEMAPAGEVQFLIELVSGTDVLNAGRMMIGFTTEEGGSYEWEIDQYAPYASGTGVYEITPYWNNIFGKSTVVELTVAPVLDNETIDAISNLVFRNGQEVPAYTFTGTYPQGAVVKWAFDAAASDMQIGSASSGTNTIPAFVASNETLDNITAVYRVWLEYNGCTQYDENDESTYVTFEYTVLPNTILDNDLFVLPVEAMAICYDANTFGEIVLTASHARFQSDLDIAEAGDVAFTIELKSGQNVLGYNGTFYYVLTSEDGASVSAFLNNDDPSLNFKSGTGLYTVTPYWKNLKGNSIDIELTIYPELIPAQIDLQPMVYKTGEVAPEYTFTGTYPEGTIVRWALVSENNIGSAFSGTNSIPSFTTVNDTKEAVTAVYHVWPEYAGCSNYDMELEDTYIELTITVLPNSVFDADLFLLPIEGQSICFDADFDQVVLTAMHNYNQGDIESAPVGSVAFTIELESGVNVLGYDGTFYYAPTTIVGNSVIASLDNDGTVLNYKAGTGKYKITPYWNNLRGEPKFVELTVYPELDAEQINVANMLFQNGQSVPEYTFTGTYPQGAIVEWQLVNEVEIGTEFSGTGSIPAFVASNETEDILTATYNVWLANGNGYGCKSEPIEFTITVLPKSIDDIDLLMIPVEDQSICFYDEFNPIELTAVYMHESNKSDLETAPAGQVLFLVELVENTNVLGYPGTMFFQYTEEEGSTYTLNLPNASPFEYKAGTGKYKVTPYWKNLKGQPTYFELTVYPDLDAEGMIVVENMTFVNGQSVSDYIFEGTYPEDAKVIWEMDENATDLQKAIGTALEGVNHIPAFVAVNKTSAPITTTYYAWLKYKDCESRTKKEFTITVKPSLIQDINLSVLPVDPQTICAEDKFEDVDLVAIHKFEALTEGDVSFDWQFVKGVDVLGFPKAGTTDVMTTAGTIAAAAGDSIAAFELSTGLSEKVGTGTYRVFAICDNNISATSIEITLTRNPKPEVIQVNDFVLCNNSPLKVEFEGVYPGTTFTWTVTGDREALGIPENGTGNFDMAVLKNGTEDAKTVTITVTPSIPVSATQPADCEGETMSFDVTVMPTPKVKQIETIILEHGEVLADLPFEGVATNYRWLVANASIFDDPQTENSGTSLVFPGFKAKNDANEPIISKVTVTPIWEVDAYVCEGDMMEFYIVVASKPALLPIPDAFVCHDVKTEIIHVSGLNDGHGYFISWTGGESIGLADFVQEEGAPAPAARPKSIPAFIAVSDPALPFEPTVVTITVTPWVAIGDKSFAGESVEFDYVVYPPTIIEDQYTKDKAPIELSFCHAETVSMFVDIASGYNETYQWYKDHVAIPGATDKEYVIEAATLQNAGTYYAMVTGTCGAPIQSISYVLEVKPNVIEQRWDDVLILNCNPLENGGFDFVSYQWYLNGEKLNGEVRSYVQAATINATDLYHVVAQTKSGEIYVACPVSLVAIDDTTIAIAPNPVLAGKDLTVTISSTPEGAKIMVYDLDMRLWSSTNAQGSSTQVKMPNQAGVYIVNILIGDSTKTFKVIVL